MIAARYAHVELRAILDEAGKRPNNDPSVYLATQP